VNSVATGAGSLSISSRAEADLKDLTAQFERPAPPKHRWCRSFCAVAGDQASVAAAKAQIAMASAQVASVEAQYADAKWKLDETTVYAPADGYAINVQLRPGSTASQIAALPVMSFVETEQWVIALFAQNELREVQPGNDAEIALRTYPNKIIKCKVDSIVWATGQGQMPSPGRFPRPASHRFPGQNCRQACCRG
jgi:multidrug resistance efflux pump